MLMSDSIDTAACSFLNVQAPGPPGSLNKSAPSVNHVALLRDQKGKERVAGMERKREGRWRREESRDVMSGSETCSQLQFSDALASSEQQESKEQ